VKRVLLTGASGFVGRTLPARLEARGFEVHVIGRDLLGDDPAALAGEVRATHLLHLAWYAEPGLFWSAGENLDWVAASLRLARAFLAAGGRRIVAAGSCAEYDWSHSRLDERETPLNPATLYGEAKASLFRTLDKASRDLGFSFGWGRIFFPYGPEEKGERLLGGLFDSIARGEPVALSEGRQQRDFMHVEDVADAFAALLDSEVQGAVNIASGETVSVRDLARRAARIAGAEHLLDFGARPMQPGEPPLLAASVGRLHGELGFSPRFTLDSGLRDMHARRPAPVQQKA
jgi:nucleoside-diphosphate-sugar epimerase